MAVRRSYSTSDLNQLNLILSVSRNLSSGSVFNRFVHSSGITFSRQLFLDFFSGLFIVYSVFCIYEISLEEK